jgi:hypothetical protein
MIAKEDRMTFRSLLFIFALLTYLVLGTTSFAKPNPTNKAFGRSCAQVWKSAKAVVRNHYDVLSLNDQEQAGSFTTGSAWSGVRPIAFALNGSGDTCVISVTGHFSGLIHNDKGDFFQRVQNDLGQQSGDEIVAKGAQR